ncbi:MAG: hypothetical protein IH858_06065 [Chloroflexi bacterium]|nr:hypothetical protein [Chloroflexota bacterium]
MKVDTVRIDALLRELGKSMLEAQTQINRDVTDRRPGPEGLRIGVTISETEIDVKMVFEDDSSGGAIRLVSAGAARLADLDPGVLSSIRARLLAVPEEEVRPPVRKMADVVDEVFARRDVRRLRNIFGELLAETAYVSAAGRWIVDIKNYYCMV